MTRIEHDEVCTACNGTGLYVGMGERDGFAVVCHKCNGTGCFEFIHEYEPFRKRMGRNDVERVLEVNPGICAGKGKHRSLELSDFGGMPYKEWAEGRPFPQKSEMRAFTCPAWWYQSADYKRKPDWRDCEGVGRFSSCANYAHKELCWRRFDEEEGNKK